MRDIDVHDESSATNQFGDICSRKEILVTVMDSIVPVCVAVPVPAQHGGIPRCAVALQAPVARMSLAQAIERLPRLQAAAQALARTWGVG